MTDDPSGLHLGLLAGFQPGSIVAGYQVEDRLGVGGMAVVFRARDVRLGRLVALKVLAPALAADHEFRTRFIREWRAATAVDHPHIIPVYAADEAGDVLYIAMRLVSGGDLRTLVRREGPLDPGRAAGIVSAVAAALDTAHAAGLVHRDVKPGNILIDTVTGLPDHVYLSDFGLSKGMASSAGLTGTGQFLGTPGFAAPEQISGGRVDGRTDQYALACVAFTLLTGRPVFTRDTPMAVMFAHMQDPPPAAAVLRPGLPRAVDQVLARALAKSPDNRYRTCGEFAAELRSALGAVPGAGGSGRADGDAGHGTHLRADADDLNQMRTAPPTWGVASHQDTGPAKPLPAKPLPAPGVPRQPAGQGRGSRRTVIAAAAALVLVAAGATAAVLMSSSGDPPATTADGGRPSVASSSTGAGTNSPSVTASRAIATSSPAATRSTTTRAGTLPVTPVAAGASASPGSTAEQNADAHDVTSLSCSDVGSIGSTTSAGPVTLGIPNYSGGDVRVYRLGPKAQGYPVEYVTTVPPHTTGTTEPTAQGQIWMLESQGGVCMGVWGINGTEPYISGDPCNPGGTTKCVPVTESPAKQ